MTPSRIELSSSAVAKRSTLVSGAVYNIAILLADGAFSNVLVKKFEALVGAGWDSGRGECRVTEQQ